MGGSLKFTNHLGQALHIKPVGQFEIYLQHVARAKKLLEAVFSLQMKILEDSDSSLKGAVRPPMAEINP